MALTETVAAAPVADDPTPSVRAADGLLGVVGIVTGLGAIAASSCCVVPLTLAFLGAGAGIFGALEALVSWRTPLLVASGVGVAVGWFAWWQRRRATCEPGSACAARPRSRASLSLLFLATLIVVTAISWDYLEPSLLKLVRSA
ncbi:MAG: mercury transporter MerT [Bosea sp.]|uniref:mercuric transporter MerT family protein n=1 Tax=Bosea sp. (in: a-proteobacteria) TaxID=1871050 RepID=UPI00239126D0|nr:mercury transporter MerT [Bosea sp. (in: a-proteobacteria)]MCP4738667.1 mercury transporter MerT [Bosea sp. (in: a-proteobacteria)]